MKILLIYLGTFGLMLTLIFGLILQKNSPEEQIVGQWKELNWQYEKVDKTDGHLNYKYISDYVKDAMGQNLIIHQAETWTFLEGGKLKLTSAKREEIVNWRIKGRGHILELRHDNNDVEYYDLTELNEHTMVLNFDSDMQVRGIAKLTFEKI